MRQSVADNYGPERYVSPNSSAVRWQEFFELIDEGEDDGDVGEVLSAWSAAETAATARGVSLAASEGASTPGWTGEFLALSQHYRDLMRTAGWIGEFLPNGSMAEQLFESAVSSSPFDPRNFTLVYATTNVAFLTAKAADCAPLCTSM